MCIFRAGGIGTYDVRLGVWSPNHDFGSPLLSEPKWLIGGAHNDGIPLMGREIWIVAEKMNVESMNVDHC